MDDQTAYPADRDSRVAWFHPDVPNGKEPRVQNLPADVFDRLDGYDNAGASPTRVKWYATRADANAALVRAVEADAPAVVG
jgi:hypothetical protein